MALTLRLLGGLTTPEIARAFLVSEATVAQRLVRAKRTLRDANVPLRGAARRASSTRACPRCWRSIYLVFNEGYAASAGEDWIRPALCEEALRLGRILAELAPARAGGARADRAAGDPGLAQRAPGSGPAASRCCCSTRTARAGTRC